MKSKMMLIVAVVILVASSAQGIQQGYLWLNPEVDTTQSPATVRVPTTGISKALVLVVAFPDDSICQPAFDTLDTLYPSFYDYLIAPHIDSALNDTMYKWSLTNFLYTASLGKDTVIGDVNPGYNGRYIIAPESLSTYQIFGGVTDLEKDIIEVADSVINFDDYNVYGDDEYVDFVFFVHPRNPVPASNPFQDEHNYGYKSGDSKVATKDTTDNGDTVTVCRRIRLGSTNSYYTFINDPYFQINQGKSINLMAHELGHAFETGNNLRFGDALPDYYESADSSNPHAWSAGQGKYSVMQCGYLTNHAHLYSPWERIRLGWITPTVIDTNSQNIRVLDINTIPTSQADWDSIVYKIPVSDSEYFLISNHQQTTHWEDDFGLSHWDDYFSDSLVPADTNAKGLLIWHVYEYGYGARYMPYELAKWMDVECAEGLLGRYGGDDSISPWGSEAGWDRIDRWKKFTKYTRPIWDDWNRNEVNSSTSSANDFFRDGYRTAFHCLTNPSSDAYNTTSDSNWGRFYYVYPDSSYKTASWGTATEKGYRQNIATHVGIEGIGSHPTISNAMQVCIRRSRIWTDSIDAMDRSTQRKFIFDTYKDTFHFIYPSKNYVYYTQSYDPSERWYTADLLGRGKWPAIILDKNYRAIAVWFSDSVQYNYHNNNDDWYYTEVTAPYLDLTGTPGPVSLEYTGVSGVGAFPGTNDYTPPQGYDTTIDMVHLAYITRDGSEDKLFYSFFPKTQPDSIYEDPLDTLIDEDSTRLIGASIAVDDSLQLIHIAYGCKKNDTVAIYYLMRTPQGWSDIYQFPTSISSVSGEDLVPFIDVRDSLVRIVFNANDSVYCNAKYRWDDYDDWDTISYRVGQNTGKSFHPQIAKTTITWIHVSDTSDTNAYYSHYPYTTFTEVDSAYASGETHFCCPTETDNGVAYMYQIGHFTGPKWGIYYRRYDGFGGNQENEGNPIPFIPPEPPEFVMFLDKNILRANQFNVFTQGSNSEIRIYDVTGRQVTRFEIIEEVHGAEMKTTVDCRNWSTGIYFVRAVPEKGPIYTKKLVLLN